MMGQFQTETTLSNNYHSRQELPNSVTNELNLALPLIPYSNGLFNILLQRENEIESKRSVSFIPLSIVTFTIDNGILV